MKGPFLYKIPRRQEDGVLHASVGKGPLGLRIELPDGVESVPFEFQPQRRLIGRGIEIDDHAPDTEIPSLLDDLCRRIPRFVKELDQLVPVHLFSRPYGKKGSPQLDGREYLLHQGLDGGDDDELFLCERREEAFHPLSPDLRVRRDFVIGKRSPFRETLDEAICSRVIESEILDERVGIRSARRNNQKGTSHSFSKERQEIGPGRPLQPGQSDTFPLLSRCR
ncbi:MAG: hypothetical protein A2170_15360 [Deltaproteobacteria bacterium RBG_13_53_10]|nr:MAG: hypothetical protein A2170_15360 [Deltaproteobacteria bacterium RBG_13_53_10]